MQRGLIPEAIVLTSSESGYLSDPVALGYVQELLKSKGVRGLVPAQGFILLLRAKRVLAQPHPQKPCPLI